MIGKGDKLVMMGPLKNISHTIANMILAAVLLH
jgi:hypothetical protein